jgi:hypothetical protein
MIWAGSDARAVDKSAAEWIINRSVPKRRVVLSAQKIVRGFQIG